MPDRNTPFTDENPYCGSSRSNKGRDNGLFVSDAELFRRLGVSNENGQLALLALGQGFPGKDPLFGNRRYWPAVVRFLDVRYRLADKDKAPRWHMQEGYERIPIGDGKVQLRAEDGRTWIEDAKPTDPKSWRKKRELKPRRPPA